MPRATRESSAIDRVENMYGEHWLVSERRPTAHDFDLLIGWPDADGRQGATVITTAALAEYLSSVERLRDVDLPVGRTTLKRLRADLDLSFDWDGWWKAREEDLRTLTLAKFAAKHNCSTGAASQRRARISPSN